jgi:hypothetical protein
MIKYTIQCTLTSIALLFAFHYSYLLTPLLDNTLNYLSAHHHLSPSATGANQITSWSNVFASSTLMMLASVMPVLLISFFTFITHGIHGFLPIYANVFSKSPQLNKTARNLLNLTRIYRFFQFLCAIIMLVTMNPWIMEPTFSLYCDVLFYSLFCISTVLCINRKYISDILRNTRKNNTLHKEIPLFKSHYLYFNKHGLSIADNQCYITSFSIHTTGKESKKHRIGIAENEQFTLFPQTKENGKGK